MTGWLLQLRAFSMSCNKLGVCVCVCLNMSEYVSFLLNTLEFWLHDTTLGFSAFGDAKRGP